MRIYLKKLILCIAIPLIVGGLSAFLTMSAMDGFNSVNQPPLSPPSWLFPVVWSILYVLMGIGSYLVLINGNEDKGRIALTVYGIQLFFNFFWSIIFFNLQAYLLAFIWLVILWLLIIVNIFLFYKISKPAGILLIPYLLWVTFAGYLNLAIYFLN